MTELVTKILLYTFIVSTIVYMVVTKILNIYIGGNKTCRETTVPSFMLDKIVLKRRNIYKKCPKYKE